MIKKENWVFIINPTSGAGFGQKMIPEIEKQISARSVEAEIVPTEFHGHASAIAEEYLNRGFTNFIAVGGDGTMNEVAKPLINKPGIKLGIVPAGTGNDFIQILGFPDRFEDKHWDILFRQNTMAMDVGLVNGIHFLNGMGLGFDAQVAAENYVEPGEVTAGSGKSKYLWHILKTLLFYKEGHVTIETSEGRNETDCFINTISIGRRFAGSFLLTPKAIANDGLLDVCMIKKLNLLQRLRILTMVPKGTHVEDKKINYYQTEKIFVDFGKKVPFHVDGELYFDTTFDVTLLPGALKMIYNPLGNHYFN